MVRLTGSCAVVVAALALFVWVGPAAAEERFTLDGRPATREEVRAPVNQAGGCSEQVNSAGVYECFSTKARRDSKVRADVAAGRVPGMERRRGARAATHQYCQHLSPVTDVYTGRNHTGTHGWFYATGYRVWVNHSSDFRNTITSYHAAYSNTPRWHDWQNGSGPYYDAAHCGRTVYDLANGDWNNRFESYAAWRGVSRRGYWRSWSSSARRRRLG